MQLAQAQSVLLLLFLTVMLLVLLFPSVLQLRLAEHWNVAGELTGTLEAAGSPLKPAAPGGWRLHQQRVENRVTGCSAVVQKQNASAAKLLPMVAARRG